MKPRISVIIIDKDDLGISDTLNGLDQVEKPAPTEIIVIDASDPKVLAHIRRDHPDVTWVQYKQTSTLKSSIPEQRNLGVRTARGDIIAFIDANCIPQKDWLVKLTTPLLDGDESMAAGRTTSQNPKTLANTDPVHTAAKYRNSAATVNFALTRAVFDAVGGFDEQLDFGSDVDFTWRAIDLGYQILWVPEASVSHDWGTTGDELRRAFKYGRAKAVLYAKHPHKARSLQDDLFVPMYLGYLLFLPLTFFVIWYPLLIVLPMARNIGHRPFKTAVINGIFSLGFAREAIVRTFARAKQAISVSA